MGRGGQLTLHLRLGELAGMKPKRPPNRPLHKQSLARIMEPTRLTNRPAHKHAAPAVERGGRGASFGTAPRAKWTFHTRARARAWARVCVCAGESVWVPTSFCTAGKSRWICSILGITAMARCRSAMRSAALSSGVLSLAFS